MEKVVTQDKELGHEFGSRSGTGWADAGAVGGAPRRESDRRVEDREWRTTAGERRSPGIRRGNRDRRSERGWNPQISLLESSEEATTWSPGPRPLWKAEMALRKLQDASRPAGHRAAFGRRIVVLFAEIVTAVEKLLTRRCSVVFIGKVGVGKTSAICHISDLTVTGPGSPRPRPVLDVGAGRTTLCEVHVRTGPTSIVIDPVHGRGDP